MSKVKDSLKSYREMDEKQILETVEQLQNERWELRFGISMQQQDVSTSRLRDIRRSLARLNTILSEKKSKD